MNNTITLGLAQINTQVGNIKHNSNLLAWHCQNSKTDLVLFPEMAISGYPCYDLWQKNYFITQCSQEIKQISAHLPNNSYALLGCPLWQNNKLYNAVALANNKQILQIFAKKSLPNHGVFQEKRYFQPSNTLNYFSHHNFDFALLICEDFWDKKNWLLLAENQFDAVLVLNSSPYSQSKPQNRQKLAIQLAKTLQKPVIYLNQVGGQDGLVFDGNSFILDKLGNVVLQMANFITDFAKVSLDKTGKITILSQQNLPYTACNIAQQYTASVLGLSDYLAKNSFQKVIIGMSGGIDSALVATIAVDALGPNYVKLYALPTKFNSQQSYLDAKICAENLNTNLEVINIESIFTQFLNSLQNQNISALATENLQARIRGNILMAIANSSGALLLSTGNKSELACGYATLYGDMCGGFNPIADFYKTTIYNLANWRNENLCTIGKHNFLNVIPTSILQKEPSAELRFNQKDSDSLPPYDILDKILFALVEEQKSVGEVADLGFSLDLVKQVATMLYRNEFKRQQANIGLKTSDMCFNLDWQYPISNSFTD